MAKLAAAHHKTEQLCRRQQTLESKLIKIVGSVRLPAELDTKNMTTESHVNRQDFCVSSYQARWDAADAEIGHSAAKKAEEEEAAEHEQEMAEILWATPAQSLAGIAGKLDAVLREGEWCEECSEFPWLQIRSALTDVIRLGGLEGLIPRK